MTDYASIKNLFIQTNNNDPLINVNESLLWQQINR